MPMPTHEEFQGQIKMIETWLKVHTQIARSISQSVFGVMLWLSKEAELQGKSWRWTLEHSRIHLASKQCWQSADRKVRGRVGTNYAAEAALRSLKDDLPRHVSGRLANGVLADLERGYGLKEKRISWILRHTSAGSAEVSPERVRSHCLGRPQKRGESNPKWHFIVPPPLPGSNKDQLTIPSLEP